MDVRVGRWRKLSAKELMLLWCWRRLLNVPWTARRSNQSTLKEISPGCSLEGLMLKLQYFDHLMRRADSLEKTLILGKIQGGRRRERQRMDGWIASPTWWTWIWVSSRSWWWTRKPGVLQSMGLQRVGHDWATELKWTENVIQVDIVIQYVALWEWGFSLSITHLKCTRVVECISIFFLCWVLFHCVVKPWLGYAHNEKEYICIFFLDSCPLCIFTRYWV